MPPRRLLRTSTFLLTVGYLGLFCLSTFPILLIVYYTSAGFMEEQTRDELNADLNVLLSQYANGGRGALDRAVRQRAQAALQNEAQGAAPLNVMYGLFDRDGFLLAGNVLGSLPMGRPSDDGQVIYLKVGVAEPLAPPGSRRHRLAAWVAELLGLGWRPDGSHEAVAKVVGIEADQLFLLVGRDVQGKVSTLRFLRFVIGLGTATLLLLGLLGGYVMSRWTLGRLDRVNRATNQIIAGDLARRIEVGTSGDEFDELARNLNAMLERIERLLAAMRQVTDDIAHDLRTPLTRLRSRVELALMGNPDAAEGREVMEATVRDADGLIETFNALLGIARAEAGAPRGEWEAMDLAEIARDVAELYEPLAEERGIALAVDAVPARAAGNRQLVAQAIANLVDNAIKYGPPGSRVTLRTAADEETDGGGGGGAVVEVADGGPGIPADQRERAKGRFVRLDETRSTTPGSGLGLSLVDAVARLHDARLELLDNAPGLRARLAFRPPPPAGDQAAAAAAQVGVPATVPAPPAAGPVAGYEGMPEAADKAAR